MQKSGRNSDYWYREKLIIDRSIERRVCKKKYVGESKNPTKLARILVFLRIKNK